MKLILGGGGDELESKAVHKLFVDALEENKKVLYIPVAWKSGNFESCKAWFEATIKDLEVTDYDMWTDLNNKSYKDLVKFGGIYIGGGNTYLLLKTLRETNFDGLLVKYIESNRPVFGGSAGAIIFGQTIDTAAFCNDPDENNVGLNDTRGLDLANGYAIQCHFVTSQKNEMTDFVNKSGAPAIALSVKSGLYVADDNMKIIGFEPGYVFTKTGISEYAVGQDIH